MFGVKTPCSRPCFLLESLAKRGFKGCFAIGCGIETRIYGDSAIYFTLGSLMSVVEKLMDGAVADIDVLRSLDAQGDVFVISRDVDFLLRAPNREKAELVAQFINEYQYGAAIPLHDENGDSVQVVINMPITQNVILSVSGFMTCLAAIYDLEFDGWGCVAQSRA